MGRKIYEKITNFFWKGFWIYFHFTRVGLDPTQPFELGQNWPGPSEWIICRTWIVSSRSACNFTVANGGVEWEATLRRRRGCCHWPRVRLEVVWSWKTRGWLRRWWRVLAAGVAVGERRNRFVDERERFTMALDGRLVASCGGAGGWRRSWRKKRQLQEGQ